MIKTGLIIITLITSTLSSTAFCNDMATVPVKFINQTNDDIDYSLIITQGINDFPASSRKIIFGKDYLTQISNQPVLSHGQETDTRNYNTYVDGVSAEDNLAFSLQTRDGQKFGLKQKPLTRTPHYCNITADDANYPVLYIYKYNDFNERELMVATRTDTCSFGVTEGYDLNQYQLEPSSPTPPPPVPHSTQKNGNENYQLELANNPNLESEINALYLRYTGMNRDMAGITKSAK